MSRIIKKEQLSEIVWRFRLHAPRIAKKERIPLTIADAQAEDGWIEVIFQVVGLTTTILAGLEEGNEVTDLVGPLGSPTHIDNFGRCVCIGGGVGVAPLYPIVCALHEAGNDVTTIIGARNERLLILKDELARKSKRLLVATDDGSVGHHGFVSDVFKELAERGEGFDYAIVIGPPLMMKVTSGLTVANRIRTYASLNPIMVDGTGMCGGCRVTVHGETRFACVDGPEFDAAGIDWDELIKRLGSYKLHETTTLEKHRCRMEDL
jgi:NAD(P)H-flavin reductase